MYDKDEIKRNLSIEQVVELLEALGVEQYKIHSGVIMTENICHNLPGESNGLKLYYYDNTNLFRCYTECREYFDIFELIIKAKEVQSGEIWTITKAINWVAAFFNLAESDSFDVFESETVKFLNSLNKQEEKINKKETNRKEEIIIYDDYFLNNFTNIPSRTWLKEGITKEVMDAFEIKYHLGQDKIIIPHRNINGELIGVRGRTVVKEEAELFGKYRPIVIEGTMYTHPLSYNLYGLNKAKNNISLMKKVIIAESEKSVLLYSSYFGVENNICVACCGSSISKYQVDLLMSLGVEEIIIAFDKEFEILGSKEHVQNVKSLCKLKEKFPPCVKISCLYDSENNLLNLKDSPLDRGKEVFLTMFNNRIIL